MVARMPPGFAKIMEGFRKLRGRRERVAHLVYSDGLVSVSVFIEPLASGAAPVGLPAEGRPQRVQRQAGRLPDHRDGRDARRDRAPDRPFRRRAADYSPHRPSPSTYKRNVMFSPAKSLVTASGAALVALLPLVAPSPALAQGRPGLLPDFTELYERQGPAVVSIDVTQKARRQRAARHFRGRSVLRVLPPLRADSPQRSAAAASSANSRRSRPDRASSSRPTATSSPTPTSSTNRTK